MTRVIFSSNAQRDLFEIGDYIAQDSRRRARTFITELRSACVSLDSDPSRFPLHQDLAHYGVRKRPFGAYLILYRVASDKVEIARIVHGARDIKDLVF